MICKQNTLLYFFSKSAFGIIGTADKRAVFPATLNQQ